MTKKFLTIPAVVAGALGIASSIAWGAEPTTSELMDQIKQLQSKVSEMEGRQNTMSDAQVGATIDSVLKDAEKRSQLLQMEGFTAGHDGKNFVLKSADGAYSLSPRFQFQFRHTLNWSQDAKNGGEDDETIKGFEIRRMKVAFVGNAISPDLTYNFRWATDRSGGSLALENAYVQYKFADQWAFKVGQWKDNVFHEETTSSAQQLAAERSLLNETLGGGWTDYVQGAALLYGSRDSPVRAELAATDGANTDNTDFQDSGGSAGAGVANPNFGFSARVEWAANNNFTGYDDFTAMGNKEDLFVLGGGIDWTQAGDNNAYFHTIDAQWENTSGLGIYAAYVGHYLESGDDDTYNWGALVQAGYMLNDKWEVFGRFNYMNLDEDSGLVASADNDDFYEITGGVNYYFKGHAAKMTIDVGYLPEGSPISSTGSGIFASDDQDQFYVRGQFQLLL